MTTYSMGTGAVGLGKPDPSPGSTTTVTVTLTRLFPDGFRTEETYDTEWSGYTADDARRYRVDHSGGQPVARDGGDLIITRDGWQWIETRRYHFQEQTMTSRVTGLRTCRDCFEDFTVYTHPEYKAHRIGTCPTCKEQRANMRRDRVGAIPDGVVMPSLPGALCAGQDPELWQTEEPEALGYARSECALCPAANSCLTWALSHDEVGTWAGTTRRQRDRMKRYAS